MNESDIINAFRRGDVQLPPLEIRLIEAEAVSRVDAVIDVAWGAKGCRYVVQCKGNARSRALRDAIDQAKRFAQVTGRGEPMVIVPYLTARNLDELLAQGVSGIDLCGNGAVESPGQFSVYRTGFPNRYRESASLRSTYRGDTSLVARAVLLESGFEAVGDILDFIESRGGSLTLGTVSKALKRLEEDLVIERLGKRAVQVIDPEKMTSFPKLDPVFLRESSRL